MRTRVEQPGNIMRVFEAIRRRGEVSRTDIVAATRLAPSTITTLTARLLDKGLIRECRGPARARGRPHLLLRANDGDGALVGGVFVHIDSRIDLRIANLAGQEIATFSRQMARHVFDPGFGDELVATICDLCAGAEKSLIGLGVSVNAPIDTHQGVVHWMAPSRPPPLALRAILEARLGTPVYVDNMANIIARTERWHEDDAGRSEDIGRGEDVEPADGETTVLVIGAGLTIARFSGGALRYGAHGFNPEFGHVKVPMATSEECPCGGTGCLVTVAAHYAVLRRAIGLDRMLDPTLPALDEQFDAVVAAAEAGDARLRGLFADAGAAIGAALANHVNTLDPARLVIVAQHPTSLGLMRAALLARLEADTLWFLRGRAQIVFRDDPATSNLDGALALVLEHLVGLR